MNNFLKEFKDRGYFYQCTDEIGLSKLLNSESSNVYIGLIVRHQAYMLEVYYRLCALGFYKNMGIDQLYFWVEEQQELVIHQEKKKQEK